MGHRPETARRALRDGRALRGVHQALHLQRDGASRPLRRRQGLVREGPPLRLPADHAALGVGRPRDPSGVRQGRQRPARRDRRRRSVPRRLRVGLPVQPLQRALLLVPPARRPFRRVRLGAGVRVPRQPAVHRRQGHPPVAGPHHPRRRDQDAARNRRRAGRPERPHGSDVPPVEQLVQRARHAHRPETHRPQGARAVPPSQGGADLPDGPALRHVPRGGAREGRADARLDAHLRQLPDLPHQGPPGDRRAGPHPRAALSRRTGKGRTSRNPSSSRSKIRSTCTPSARATSATSSTPTSKKPGKRDSGKCA